MKHVFNSLFLVLVLAIGSSFFHQANATHFAGADLTYTHISGNTYEVTVTWIRDCSGVPINTNNSPFELHVEGCGWQNDYTLAIQSNQTITPTCLNNPCGNPNATIQVYEQYVCTTMVTLPSQPCANFVFSVSGNNRNDANITTLNINTSDDLFVQATLDNTGGNHSSPSFGSIPSTTLCVGQPFSFNNLGQNNSGGGTTLSYSLVNPLGDNGVPITYATGYSLTNPYIGTFNFDPTTGAFSGTPTQLDVTVINILVTETDANGNVISTVMRDIQVQIIMCNNALPVANPTTVDDTICIDDLYTLVITSSDADNDEVNMSWGMEIAGATFTVVNNNSANPFPTGTFSWTPTAADHGQHSFTVTLQDTACPQNGINVYTYNLYVDSCCTPPTYVLGSCCEVQIETGKSGIIGGKLNRMKAMAYLDPAALQQSLAGPFPDTCDPCVDGGYPVWVEDGSGTPVDVNDSDPCITIEWLDDQGNVIYTGWAFWATVDEHYTVRVTNTCDGCVWEQSFTYECCPPLNLSSCCTIEVESGAQNVVSTSKNRSDAIKSINQSSLNYSGGDTSSTECDPCIDGWYPVWVEDENGNPVGTPGDPCYTVEWFDDQGNLLFTGWSFPANVDEDYTVRVTNSCDGCVWEESFTYTCCPTPENPRCTLGKFNIPTYWWDPVPGAMGYQIQVVVNDPNCCPSPSTNPNPLPIINVGNTTFWTPNVSYICASWSVRAICKDGFSDWTTPICMNGHCRVIQTPKRGSLQTGENQLKTYPSPASQTLTVEGQDVQKGASLVMVDVSGRIVLTQVVEDAGKQQINIANLPNGIYCLQVKGPHTNLQSKKVVVLH